MIPPVISQIYIINAVLKALVPELLKFLKIVPIPKALIAIVKRKLSISINILYYLFWKKM